MPDIADQTLFVQRVVNARHRGVVFLVGSGLVAPMSADQPGVPAVDGMVDLIRARYRGQAEPLAAFERHLEAAQTNRYQAAFQYLQRTHGQDEVNRVIREGVLKARWKELTGEAVQEGDLTALEQDMNGWFISPALEELGRIVTQFPDEYGRYVLTTNFDPLIEVAIRRERSWIGLTLCVDILPDPILRDRLIEELLAGRGVMRWAALRAVGRLGETSQAPMLRKELFGRDPLERGVAALALAHLEGRQAFTLLQRTWRDGASALERIFSALAMLKVDPESWGQVEQQLRADLAVNSPYLLFLPLQLDIMETLRSVGREGANSLAEAWEPFFYRLD